MRDQDLWHQGESQTHCVHAMTQLNVLSVHEERLIENGPAYNFSIYQQAATTQVRYSGPKAMATDQSQYWLVIHPPNRLSSMFD
jgi:hypothetical protein